MMNPDALGNAWFVKNLYVLKNADEMMKSLDTLSAKENAITLDTNLKNTHYITDSLAGIKLEQYEPDRLVYTSDNQQKGLAVFSEIYYPKGWKAIIDHKEELPIYEVNYTLRALEIPAGKHHIEFLFSPKSVEIGGKITLFSSIIFRLVAIGIFFRENFYLKKLKQE